MIVKVKKKKKMIKVKNDGQQGVDERRGRERVSGEEDNKIK